MRRHVDIITAVIIIQKCIRGFLARRKLKKTQKIIKDLPDLKCKDMVKATVKIQSAYKGFQTRKKVLMRRHVDILTAVIIIQKCIRGFLARRRTKKAKEYLPDLK